MFQVTLVLVTIELFAKEHEPILLQSAASFLFLEDLALIVYGVTTFTAIA